MEPQEPTQDGTTQDGFTLTEALALAERIGGFGEPGEYGPHFFVRGIVLMEGEDWHAHHDAHYRLLLNYADDVSEMTTSISSAGAFDDWRLARLPVNLPWLRQMAVRRDELPPDNQ